jgi:hypothetical protein
MHTFADMSAALNRPTVYLSGLQSRFQLPVFEGAGYSDAYLAFLRTVVHLRVLSISEETLREVWHLEKKLLQLLHLDSTGSPTWFLDQCGMTGHLKQRLLLTNHDLGVHVPARSLQLGLNFDEKHPELFAGKDMGEDALRVLNEYLKLDGRIRDDVIAELPQISAAAKWAKKL